MERLQYVEYCIANDVGSLRTGVQGTRLNCWRGVGLPLTGPHYSTPRI